MITIMSRSLSVQKGRELLLKFEAAGLTDDLAQRIIQSKSNELAEKVVHIISGEEYLPSTGQVARAREIMGSNFFGVEDATRCFRINPSKKQSVHLAGVPYSQSTLKACKETHMLAAVLPLSVLDMQASYGARSNETLRFDT